MSPTPARSARDGAILTRSASEGGVYLYCFTRASAPSPLPPFPARGGPEQRERGLADTATAVLRVDSVAAVCSAVDLDQFTENMALQSPDWIIPEACRHEQVVETAMTRGAVLPIRFGTVFSSSVALERFLRARRQEIAGFLDDFGDRQEWGLRGYLDLRRAAEWQLSNDPRLAEQQRRLPNTPGTRYFQEKKLHAAAGRQARSWGRELAGDIVADLKKEALDVCPLNLRHSTGAESVLHGAFLLHRDTVPRFRVAVARLAEIHADQGLDLAFSGPWPPYHFCPVFHGEPCEQS
jgi:hypothetical protein